MASITIRNLDDDLKRQLKVRAAKHGRSMEDEAREILGRTVRGTPEDGDNLFDRIRRRFEPPVSVDLQPPKRGPVRKLPSFK